MNSCRVLNYFFKQTRRLLLSESTSSSFIVSPVRYSSNESRKEPSVLEPVESLDLSYYGSAVADRFNFAMYADKSPLIQKFINLGVDLFKIQKNPKTAEYLLTLSENKIEHYITFLSSNGVSADKLGKVITQNPLIFQENLDDLEVRINYLKSKKFDKEMIAHIITTCPKWLSAPVKVIDGRLGYLQQTFRLSGDQVRYMVTKVPKLALINKRIIIFNIYALKEEIGLDVHSLKRVVVSEPKLLTISSGDMVATYEYLLNTMNVARDLILKQPKVLSYRRHRLKERHKFLESLGRAQYCHLLPGYVSLLDLTDTSDVEFCQKIARSSEEIFNEFLKTM